MKYVWIAIVASFLLLSGIYPEHFSAATSSEILSQQIDTVRHERETLVEEQKRLQTELEKITSEGKTLGTAVKSLDSTRKKLEADIRVTQSKISSTDLNIQLLENNMTQAQSRIAIHKKAIGSALLSIAQSESRPLFLDLLASTNFSEVWRDKAENEDLSSSLTNEVENLKETKNELVKEKDRKEKVKEEILTLHKELSGQKQVVEESKKAQEILLAETKNKEALYQQMLQENLARQKESEDDIFRLESELQVKLDPTLIPSPRPGTLSWPLDTVFITQKFGKTVGAERLYASGSHNGADFRATQGTRVLAMLSGTVEGTGNTDEQKGCYSYGRWVLIKHANGLSSIYAHLSATTVKKGDVITTGEVIGYSGGTPRVFGSGYSTGPHLHVGLFASQGVSIQQFVTSKGCKQVFLPIADVKAYLDPLAYLPAL
jgi:murein DD-endopeptidase MepM/ murein hydrolase activator NlpD